MRFRSKKSYIIFISGFLLGVAASKLFQNAQGLTSDQFNDATKDAYIEGCIDSYVLLLDNPELEIPATESCKVRALMIEQKNLKRELLEQEARDGSKSPRAVVIPLDDEMSVNNVQSYGRGAI